jgi:chromosome segregation ATPase
LKGTLLFQLKSDYELLESNIETVLTKYSYHRNHILPELKAKRDGLKQKYQHCKQHGELEDRIKSMKDQMLWAQIIEQETEVADVKEKIADVKARVEKYEGQVADVNEKVKSAAVDVERLAQEVAESELSLEPLKERQMEHKEEQKLYTSQLRQLDQEKREMDESIKANRKQIKVFEKQIEEIYARGENSEYVLFV